jgi:hypothetical protein
VLAGGHHLRHADHPEQQRKAEGASREPGGERGDEHEHLEAVRREADRPVRVQRALRGTEDVGADQVNLQEDDEDDRRRESQMEPACDAPPVSEDAARSRSVSGSAESATRAYCPLRITDARRSRQATSPGLVRVGGLGRRAVVVPVAASREVVLAKQRHRLEAHIETTAQMTLLPERDQLSSRKARLVGASLWMAPRCCRSRHQGADTSGHIRNDSRDAPRRINCRSNGKECHEEGPPAK